MINLTFNNDGDLTTLFSNTLWVDANIFSGEIVHYTVENPGYYSFSTEGGTVGIFQTEIAVWTPQSNTNLFRELTLQDGTLQPFQLPDHAAATPEPATLFMLAMGLAAMFFWRGRRAVI